MWGVLVRFVKEIAVLIFLTIKVLYPEAGLANPSPAGTLASVRKGGIVLGSSDPQLMDYMKSLLLLLKKTGSPQGRSPKLIILAASDSISDGKLNQRYLSFLNRAGSLGIENTKTHNDRCFIAPLIFGDGTHLYVSVINTSTPTDSNDKKCVLLSFAMFFGFNAADFSAITQNEMLAKIFERDIGAPQQKP